MSAAFWRGQSARLTGLPLEADALKGTVGALGVVHLGSHEAVVVRVKRRSLAVLLAVGRSRRGEEGVAARLLRLAHLGVVGEVGALEDRGSFGGKDPGTALGLAVALVAGPCR
jgi:hypothetical protein